MTKEAVASWLMEHSSVPNTVLKPLATKLGLSANHLGAALFAGQIVYENQDTVVTYASKGGVTVGEFLHERARQRYGEDHPLTRSLGENVDAITEAFEGTEEEAQTFAEFYRRYRAVDREYRLTGKFDLGAFEKITDAIPGRESIPGKSAIPNKEAIPGREALPSLGGNDPDDEDVTEIPITEPE